jgi:hypothetical protein
MNLQRFSWKLIVISSILIGLYPLIYYVLDMHNQGLLQSKPRELFNNSIWYTLFYVHITFGGVALLIGWSQFNTAFRSRSVKTHRLIGKSYIISVLLSSSAGLFIAFFASGGLITMLGFGSLAVLWLVSAVKAYTTVRKRDFVQHEYWVIRNYALTFAAVMLRIYLPLLIMMFHGDFFPAYRIVSWLSWLPNLIVAELIISKKSKMPIFNRWI